MPGDFVEEAKAKINLALHVLGRRADGYHELDSIVGFADVADILSFAAADSTSLCVSGPFAKEVPDGADNLVLKAAALLSQHVAMPAVRISLTKNLPVAAGIGGGSADAAATLRGLQRLAKVQLPQHEVDAIALMLGADVPVCLRQMACRMEGVGERITPLAALPQPAIVLVNPLRACATADVFASLGLMPGQTHGSGLEIADPASWRNDLTGPAIKVLPVISDILTLLGGTPGVIAARMSGSGATCFGLARSYEDAEGAAGKIRADHPNWWVMAARLN